MLKTLTFFIITSAFTTDSFAAPQPLDETQLASESKLPDFLIAKKKKTPKNLRKKHLVGEAKKRRGSTNIDFDEASIDGRRRLPAGVAITKNRPEHEYDLINLRLRWHPEMIESTTTLDSSRE